MKLTERERKLKRRLNYHYKYFDRTQIHPDPLEFPHRYSNWYDIEISAFVSSVFAYGNIKQIMSTLEKIHKIIGDQPHKFVLNYNRRKINPFNKIKHRFYTPDDIHVLFLTLNKIYSEYKSLKYFFLLYHFPNAENIKPALSFFSKNLISISEKFNPLTQGVKFMFPSPANGSTCKRMNLFLRWMVREDELDFGLWKEISTSQLIIPVDTHVAQICKKLKFTKRENLSWFMAEEITEKLKKFDPIDPVKYDFAICHIGMRKLNF